MLFDTAKRNVSGQFFNILLIGAVLITGRAIAHQNWVILAAIVILPLVLLWPVQMSMGIFALLLPFDAVTLLGNTGITLNSVVGGLSALILLAVGIVNRRLQRPPAAALWWGLFVIWGVTSTLWAMDATPAFRRIPTAVALLLLYLIAVSFRMSQKEFSAVVLLSIIGASVAAGYASLEFLQSGGLPRASLEVAGNDTNPNQLAASLLPGLSFAFGRFISIPGRLSKIAMALAVALIGLAILLTMSRGSLLALVIVVLVFLYRLRLNWRTLLLTSLLGLLLIAMPAAFFIRVERALQDKGAGRFDIWQAGLGAFKQNALIGVGLNNFPVAYDKFAGEAPRFRGFSRDPHNVYLGISVETGIVGLLLFLAATGSQLRSVQKLHAIADRNLPAMTVACEAACWGMLAAGLSGNFVWNKWYWLPWMLLAIAVRSTSGAYRIRPRIRNPEAMIAYQ